MSESNQGSGMSIVVAAMVGAAVGAGVALLCAPCSGKETREWLANKSRELKDKTASELVHGKEAVLRVANGIGRAAEEVADAQDRRQYAEEVAGTQDRHMYAEEVATTMRR